MSRVFVRGIGAVSPAGWGVTALRECLAAGEPLAVQTLERALWPRPLPYRTVPVLKPLPDFFNHPRFRRSSPISQYAMAAAAEALGADAARVRAGELQLGVVFCVMAGCVNYSRRFYDEVLGNPATASPLVFPETVFNAPASHFAALLGASGINYTLVGDQGTYLQAVALAADWLATGRVEACLVLAAEEMDWMMVDAFHMFNRATVVSAGAGALYLTSGLPSTDAVELSAITNSHCFSTKQSRRQAIGKMRAELPQAEAGHLLCDSRQNIPALDGSEAEAWLDWSGERISPKAILGEALMAGTAWQCVAAVDALEQGRCAAASVSAAGSNQQAIGAQFTRSELPAVPSSSRMPELT